MESSSSDTSLNVSLLSFIHWYSDFCPKNLHIRSPGGIRPLAGWLLGSAPATPRGWFWIRGSGRYKEKNKHKKNKHVSFYTRYHLMVNLSQGWWRPGLPEPWRSAVVSVHRWSSQSWRLERRLIDQTCLASTSQRWLTGWRSGEVSSQVNTSESLFCFSNYPWSISVSCQGGLLWKKLQQSGKSICMEAWAWSATMPLTPGRARGSSRSSISCCCCSRGGAASCLASSSRLKLSNP